MANVEPGPSGTGREQKPKAAWSSRAAERFVRTPGNSVAREEAGPFQTHSFLSRFKEEVTNPLLHTMKEEVTSPLLSSIKEEENVVGLATGSARRPGGNGDNCAVDALDTLHCGLEEGGRPLETGSVNQHPGPHQCLVCGKTFAQKSKLEAHKLVHTASQPLSCHFCCKKFYRKDRLVEHERIHFGVRPYSCDVCGKSFSQRSHLKRHELLHSGARPHSCDVCGKSFSMNYRLTQHKRIHMVMHPSPSEACINDDSRHTPDNAVGEKAGPLLIQGKLVVESIQGQEASPFVEPGKENEERSLPNRWNTEKANNLETGSLLVQLEAADDNADEHNPFQSHVKKEEAGPLQSWIKVEGEVIGIATLNDGENGTSFVVEPLNTLQDGVEKGGRRLQTSSVHQQRRPHKCDVCGKTFTHKSGLVTHEVVHTGARPFFCDICGKRFSQKSGLNTHKLRHTGARPFLCQVCGKGFSHKGTLVEHERIHTGVRPYSCDVCGKSFSQQSNLNTHKFIHTEVRPLSCQMCNKRFFRKDRLVEHERTHSGVRPYACDVCGKRFIQQSHLSRHKQLHSGARPQPCDICGKSFSRKWRLKQHVRIHTAECHSSSESCINDNTWQDNEHYSSANGEGSSPFLSEGGEGSQSLVYYGKRE